MAQFAPFEPKPVVACGVSGGSDSLALLLLLDHWARDRGGRVEALTVDHALRPGSAEEAAELGKLCGQKGISHSVLTWRGEKPSTGVQAAAREARYQLMRAWCERQGVLHLALAHQREDQAETFLLRLRAGSGLDGLAGMAAASETAELRVLRPLLAAPRESLRGFLRASGVDWFEDPSNSDPGFERARLRAALPDLARAGLDSAKLWEICHALGRLRANADQVCAAFLARAVRLDPLGFAWLDLEAFRAAPPLLAKRALSAILVTVSGASYGPGGRPLARLHAALTGAARRSATLGGCEIRVMGKRCLFWREVSAIKPAPLPMPRPGGRAVLWDGRFSCRLRQRGARGHFDARQAWLAPLGSRPGAELRQACHALREKSVPFAAYAGLPAIHHLDGILAVPHLRYWRVRDLEDSFSCALQPRVPLTRPPFVVADPRFN
jgi:tRNA(Ile)-lysidine synthase